MLTVLMPVRDVDEFLPIAVDSLKNQTFKVTSDELGATVDAELDKIIDYLLEILNHDNI